MSAREVLDEIQARVTAATPGPWEVSDANEGMHEYGPMWMVTNDEFHNPSGGEDEPWLAVEMRVGDEQDAAFIAHARTDVPRLVAALRAVLDNHWCIEGGDECGYDGRIWPCPDYRAITEALDGTR